MKKASIILLYAFIIILGTTSCYAKDSAHSAIQASGIIESENYLDHIFLVRPPGYIAVCNEKIFDIAAVAIIDSRLVPNIKIGEDFFVITESAAVIKGALKKLISCEHDFNVDNAAFGLLKFTKKIDWHRGDAYIAIKGINPSSDILGSIRPLTKDTERICLNMIRKHIPQNEDISIEFAARIALPASSKEYDFISVDHFDPDSYKQAGDKALNTTGFLFVKANNKRPILLQKNNITKVIGLTDLNKDGIFEVIVHASDGAYEGSYEVRFLDSKGFSETKKVLYHWMD